jgi:hypothetical protein
MNSLIKLSVITVCILLLFANCSKPKDYSTDYLRGKIDGVAFECNANIKANTPEPIGSGGGSDPNINITGEWSSYSLHLHLNGDGSSLAAGAYVFQAEKNRSATIWQNGTDSYYAGNGGFFDPIRLHGSGNITILEISKSYIKGSFEFVTSVNGATGLSKNVTDGEFYIKRSK